MFLMNTFFDGAFLTFGFDVIAFAERDQEERIDPMIYIFPRMTKCTFNKFGTSGEVEKHDALCILPLNVVNEKIYIFLWFWFLILGFLTALVLLYRLIIILSPRMRAYLLYIRFRLINREVINTIVRKSKMGDWFLFYMLGQNVDSIIFKEVMHELGKKLGPVLWQFAPTKQFDEKDFGGFLDGVDRRVDVHDVVRTAELVDEGAKVGKGHGGEELYPARAPRRRDAGVAWCRPLVRARAGAAA